MYSGRQLQCQSVPPDHQNASRVSATQWAVEGPQLAASKGQVAQYCCSGCTGDHEQDACVTRRQTVTDGLSRRPPLPQLTHRALRSGAADSCAGRVQTRFWAAWAHVAYRVQYTRYLPFYCLICAGLGALGPAV